MKSCLRLVLASVIILHPSVLFAAIISVPADQPTIQAGIDAALDGDVVLVSAGIYIERIDFSGKAITVMSYHGAPSTIIDGNGSGSVVTFANGEGAGSVLDGFTIRNGRGTGFGLPPISFYGGGIYCVDASPTIRHNRIVENDLDGGCVVGAGETKGGGIFVDGGSPTIERNVISDNTAHATSGCWHGICCGDAYGGGIAILGGEATVINNVVSGNTAYGSSDGTGGGGYGRGGGLYSNGLSSIVNNVITGNGVGGQWFQYGGGAYLDSGELFANNIVTNNTAGMFVGNAGGIQCNGSPDLTHNDAWDNMMDDYGNGCGTPDPSNLSVDPSFVNPSTNLHLAPGSPCIDTGTDAGVYTDVDGEARPQGADFDIGVDEYKDLDADGWASWEDCDDTSAVTYPGGAEICDEKDNDCDELIDEDLECGSCFISIIM